MVNIVERSVTLFFGVVFVFVTFAVSRIRYAAIKHKRINKKDNAFLFAGGMSYTASMSVFVQATQAPKPKTKNIRTVGVALAGVFVVMAVAQLFTFEDFPAVIAAMWLPGGEDIASVRAAFIVALEVGAVPFLLGMRLSPAMRVCSMVAGWLAILAWFVATIMQNLSTGVIVNSGMLGATVQLPVGWWNTLLIVAMGILAAWAAWGMWPFKKRRG